MTDITFKVPTYHPVGCECLICGAANDALDKIANQAERIERDAHNIMCLKAEITARNAANKILREKVDHLEEGLRAAREQVANLLRLNQQRHDAGNQFGQASTVIWKHPDDPPDLIIHRDGETDPADSGS